MKKKKILALIMAAAMIMPLLPAGMIAASADTVLEGAFVRDIAELPQDDSIQTAPGKNQVMYVKFDSAPAPTDHLWFEVTSPLGYVYGIQATGDGTHTAFAWSYLDTETVRSWPTCYDMPVPIGAPAGNYKVRVFRSDEPIEESPLDGEQSISTDKADKISEVSTTKDTPLVINAARKGDIRLIAARFRSHPESFSIFDDSVKGKRNVLWTEFSNRVDHSDAFDATKRIYTIDGTTYQIEIARPAHGPVPSHAPAITVPGNGIVGQIKGDFTNNPDDENDVHCYHGWQIGVDGDDELFHADAEPGYQVGTYIAKLWQLDPTEQETLAAASSVMKCEDKMLISEHAIDIVEVKYQLSAADIAKGYKLTCPMEANSQTSITELARVGDVVGAITPKIDNSSADDDPKKVVAGWKLVKTEGGELSANTIGDYLPADTQDETRDGKITLEAVLSEPKSYDYQFTKDIADGESVMQIVPPGETPEPSSFNRIADENGGEKTIEYDPSATMEPLTLRVVNTGNQREAIQISSEKGYFNIKMKSVNNDEEAKKLYSQGGLESDSTLFYIPSKADKAAHPSWENYAIVTITPKQGLGVGEYSDTIQSRVDNTSVRLWNTSSITLKISPKKVEIAPRDTTKSYGKNLSITQNVVCDVYDTSGKLLESDKTAAQLGITLQSDGMGSDAEVKPDGEKYPFKLAEAASNSNYSVSLKPGTNTGITVIKAMPVKDSVKATPIKDGDLITQSVLSGVYRNPNTTGKVNGHWEWSDSTEQIQTGGNTTITRNCQFTPDDLNNYEKPPETNASIVVSAKTPTNLEASKVSWTYNGKPRIAEFRWARGSTPVVGTNVKVVYKKIEEGQEEFAPDENFTEEGGYKEDPPVDAGKYKVHATCNDTNMFAGDVENFIMTINPYTLTLDLKGSVVEKMYDGKTTAEIDPAKVKFKDKQNADDDVRVKKEAFTANFVSADVDMFYPKNVTVVVNGIDALEGDDAQNYKLKDTATYYPTGYLSIQRPIRLALKKTITKSYGDDYKFTSDDYKAADEQPTPGGLAENDSVDSLRAVVTAMNGDIDGASAEAPVGEYTVRASNLGTGVYNYTIIDEALGKLIVEKATPRIVGDVTAENGLAGNSLSSVKLDGRFINPNNASMNVEGDLEWNHPDALIEEGRQSYKWKFTPQDSDNYNPMEGYAYVQAGDKPPASITLIMEEEVVYDGNPHPARIETNNSAAQTTVQYRKTDVELHDASDADVSEWTQMPPVDAGTYEVRGRVEAFGNYASNTEIKSMTILEAEPDGDVTAGSVDRGAPLSDSQLEYNFKGVDGNPLEGLVKWNSQGVNSPSEVIVEPDTPYEWVFDPADENYRSVTGTATVAFKTNTRAADADIYNMPDGFDSIGDYACVEVDDEHLKAGDTVQFYSDEAMTEPASAEFDIKDGMSGRTVIDINDEALGTNAGTLYLNIKGSEAVTPVEYKAQIGFVVDPTLIYVDPDTSGETCRIKSSDDSYSVLSSEWVPDNDGIVSVALSQDMKSAVVTGSGEGSVRLTVTVEFAHPDPDVTDKTVKVTNFASVTVTSEQKPDYKYRTDDATDITDTGAVLNGYIDITAYGDKITPRGVGLFLLWEKNSPNGEDGAERIGVKDEIVLTQSGSYSISVGGLKPDTEYVYRAVGTAGENLTPGEPSEFRTKQSGEEPKGITVTDFTVDASGAAKADISNNGDAGVTAALISAAYDSNGAVVSVKFVSEKAQSGAEISLSTDSLDNPTDNIRAYLWDMDGYKPLVNEPAVPQPSGAPAD